MLTPKKMDFWSTWVDKAGPIHDQKHHIFLHDRFSVITICRLVPIRCSKTSFGLFAEVGNNQIETGS